MLPYHHRYGQMQTGYATTMHGTATQWMPQYVVQQPVDVVPANEPPYLPITTHMASLQLGNGSYLHHPYQYFTAAGPGPSIIHTMPMDEHSTAASPDDTNAYQTYVTAAQQQK